MSKFFFSFKIFGHTNGWISAWPAACLQLACSVPATCRQHTQGFENVLRGCSGRTVCVMGKSKNLALHGLNPAVPG